MDKTAYLAELRNPHLEISDVNDEERTSLEIRNYMDRLEELRLGFIEFLSSCREATVFAYIDDLQRVDWIITRGLQGGFSTSLPEVIDSNDRLKKLVLRGMKSSLARTIDFVGMNLRDYVTPPIQEQKPRKVESIQEEPKLESKLHKKLAEYGEFLSVKDLCDAFHVTPRTVANWEAQGFLVNISAVSEETNSLGRRKRGPEKRYLKESVIKNVALQEKFNALLQSLSA